MNACGAENNEIDIIRYLEVDLPRIFPGLYVYIEDDVTMGARRAFISENPLGIVVSESIYDAAANKSSFAVEILMHEVGHLFLHHKYAALGLNSAAGTYINQIEKTPAFNSAEWQATVFALCFLYPYSICHKYKTALEIKKTYGLSEKQAQRVKRHLDRLKIRRNEYISSIDGKWVRAVISDLPKIKTTERSADQLGQLSLFFSGNLTENKLVGV